MLKSSFYNVFIDEKKSIFNLWKGSHVSFKKDERTYLALKENRIQDICKEDVYALEKIGILTNFESEYNEVINENLRKTTKEEKSFSICISPTTFCNANCSYCFENGISKKQMDYETALKVVNYIESHFNNRPVKIRWFGGEPLLCTNIIDLICKELTNKRIDFSSLMITNGYFLADYIDKIVNDWHIMKIQVTLDGIYNDYDEVKKYNNNFSAFDRIIKNIEYVAMKNIVVGIRLNFDPKNIDKTIEMIDWLEEKFKDYDNVYSYVNHIMGNDYVLPIDCEKNPYLILFDKYQEYGKMCTLKSMKIIRRHEYCAYWRDGYINVDPEGNVYGCEHYISKKDHSCGNITDYVKKDFRDQKVLDNCRECICFPICGGGCIAERTRYKEAGCIQIKNIIKELIERYIDNYEKKEKNKNGNNCE